MYLNSLFHTASVRYNAYRYLDLPVRHSAVCQGLEVLPRDPGTLRVIRRFGATDRLLLLSSLELPW
jgi:hypothetical protein